MYLRIVDKLIKEGDYAAALDAVTKARRHDPHNRSAIAIEARVRTLIDQAEQAKRFGKPRAAETPRQNLRTAAPPPEGLPSVEGQFRAIATPFPPSPVEPPREDRSESKNLAILSKIASLLGSANEFLEKHEYDRALDVVSRAALLDPTNADIRSIEQRIRSAQQEAMRRELEEKETRAATDRMRREQMLQEELTRLQREQEDRKRNDEAERRRAQKQKALTVIQRAREFVNAGQIQEAQCELAYVSVLDPDNPEVIALEREISRRREDKQRAELEAYRLQIEEQRQREQAVRQEIAKTVREADQLATQKKFGDALRAVTRAYILDPTNTDLQACENRVAAAQKEWIDRTERERREQEESLRKKLEQEEQRQQQEERERLRKAEQDRQEEQKREKEQKILRHLRKAHEHLAANGFKEAHEEVAAAFLIDPFSEDVALLEKRITDEQTRAAQRRAEPPPPPPPPLPPPADEAIEAVVAKTLADAKRFAAERKFEQALQETALAIALDPANDMARRIEASIKLDWEEHLRQEREKSKRESAERGAAERGAAERKIAEQRAAEREAEERKIAEQRAAEREAEERKIAEQRAAIREAAERKIAEQRAAEREAAERKIAEQRAAEREAEEREAAERNPTVAHPSQVRVESSQYGPEPKTPTAEGERQAEPALTNPLREEPSPPPPAVAEQKDDSGWRRRAIAAAVVVSMLLLLLFYELTPPVSNLRPPGPGTATQTQHPPEQEDSP